MLANVSTLVDQDRKLTHGENHTPPRQAVRHLPLNCRLENHVPRNCNPQEAETDHHQRNQLTRSRDTAR